MAELHNETRALEHWLFEHALPLWWEVGADRVGGGYHEAIELNGRPFAKPHRARSIARMVFAFCEAGRLGWNGPWREAAAHALAYLDKHFICADATVASVVGLDGSPANAPFDLYEQAFALLAFACGHAAFGGALGCRRQATALHASLARSLAHPLGGFREDADGRLPQRANPHMHLLEAALAWMAVDDDAGWRAMADDLATLCLERFIDAQSGGLRELFAADWSPANGVPGRICEPGHCYEWAFLLDRWARATMRPRPQAVTGLIAFADTHGLDRRRGVAINAVLLHEGNVHDPMARLWAQAERVRAYVCEGRSEADLVQAIQGLRRFLATPVPGLWFDQLGPDDRPVPEPARATSLYHIIGAATELAKPELAKA
ncbi:MAG: AGE family epimerase/isomerase [Xanthobacteraceae bacterium]